MSKPIPDIEDSLAVAGNPIRSIVVRNLRKGYGNDAKEKGYRQRSARPWTHAEMKQIMSHMEEQLAKWRDGTQHLLHMRDALILALLWQTQSRGNNAGTWRLENLRLPTGRKLVHRCKMQSYCIQ